MVHLVAKNPPDRMPPCLPAGETHVWIVAIDARNTGDTRANALSAAEVEQAGRHVFEIDRARFVQRRTALREILAAYLRVSPREVVYAANEFGKPAVIGHGASEALSFNASHSGTLALVAVARSGRIGVDVERMRPIEHDAIAQRFFSRNEAAALAALPPHDRAAGFFNAWTRKEAVVKALGGGLTIPLDSFDVSLQPGRPPEILRLEVPGEVPGTWRLYHLEPGPGYVGALALDSATTVCRCWSWT